MPADRSIDHKYSTIEHRYYEARLDGLERHVRALHHDADELRNRIVNLENAAWQETAEKDKEAAGRTYAPWEILYQLLRRPENNVGVMTAQEVETFAKMAAEKMLP